MYKTGLSTCRHHSPSAINIQEGLGNVEINIINLDHLDDIFLMCNISIKLLVIRKLYVNLFDILIICTLGNFQKFVKNSGCYLSFNHDLCLRLMTDFHNICLTLIFCMGSSEGSPSISLSTEEAFSLTILMDSDSLLRRFTSAITSFLCNCSYNENNKKWEWIIRVASYNSNRSY